MEAKITYINKQDIKYYYVKCREDCRNLIDKSAYDEFMKKRETIAMGKVIVSATDY